MTSIGYMDLLKTLSTPPAEGHSGSDRLIGDRSTTDRPTTDRSAVRSPDQSGVDAQEFSISDLAAEFSITPRTIRFYEDKGLLAPRRRKQTRIYGRRDRARLSLILRGRRVGFSLDEIKEMLDLYDLRDGQAAQITHALGKFEQRIAVLEAQRRDIDDALGELKAARDAARARLTALEGDGLGGAPAIVGFAVPPRR